MKISSTFPLIVTLALCVPAAGFGDSAATIPQSAMHHSQPTADSPSQSSVASKTPFSIEPANKASTSLNATDLDKGLALAGKPGSFKGTVASIYSTDTNGIVIVDFAEDYQTAMTAVLFPPNYKKFPDMTTLRGKQVVVSGVFTSYKGKAQIVLNDPKQIKILK